MRFRKRIPGLLMPALLLGLLLFSPSQVTALEVPALTARVNDYAAILSPSTAQQLEGALKAFEADQSTQIVVLTIPSLEGEVLEEFAIRVAEQWKIGRKGLDNGAILLIARNERKLRIEVGYGLEGSLTDLISGRIIREVIVPQFKQGNFDQGVIDGVSAIMAAVQGEFSAADIQQSAAQQPADTQGFLVMLVAIIFFIGKVFGRSKPLAAAIGGVVAPLLGLVILGGKWLIIAALIPAGIIGGLIASIFAATAGSARSFRRSGHYLGGGFGGFGGFGGSGGGFGGGGGGFGGGGASGGW